MHYRGERAPYNQKAWDVRVGRERIEVKALRRNAHNKRTNLSPIRSESGYDVLVIVVFAEDFTIEKAVPGESRRVGTALQALTEGRDI